jgi:CCR4-NOT transcription complex subunit 2
VCARAHLHIYNLDHLIFFPLSNFLQLSHGSSHGHSGVTNRGGISVVGNPGFSSSTNGVGGSIPGILPTSGAIGNRNAVPGLGVSPILANAGPRITSSMGNMGNIGRSIGSGGGLSVPGLASRLNLNANSGSGSLNVQGQNRLMGSVLAQGINFNWLIYLCRRGLRER